MKLSHGGASGEANTTLANSLALKIRDEVLRGSLRPGAKLRLEDLRRQFGVSLSPLREALANLAAQGFVVGEDQRGYRVAGVSGEDLGEVTQLRSHCEGLALRESIVRGGDEWEERLVAIFHRLSKLEQTAGSDVDEWERAHRNFHAALIAACGMPLLLRFCSVLHDLNDRYRRLFLQTNPLDRDVWREHKEIVEAALARDPDKAEALLKQHIERTGANVLESMGAPDPAANLAKLQIGSPTLHPAASPRANSRKTPGGRRKAG